MQLAEIHENIQRMRLENAQSSRLSAAMGGKVSHKNSRLSNSCPSLNREDVENSNMSNYYNNNSSSNANNQNNNVSSQQYYGNNSKGSRKAKNYNEQQQSRQKRLQGRQRR